MILLHLTCLLNSLHCINSYRYLPANELPLYSYGTKNIFRKYLATLKDIPFHVLIVYNNLYCSGTLVRSKIVLTAASCLLTDQIRRPVVKVGVDSITGGGLILCTDIADFMYKRLLIELPETKIFPNQLLTVYFNDNVENLLSQVIPIVDIKIHEYYKYTHRIDNDIAILVLEHHVSFGNYVKKTILVEPGVALRTGASIEISGWGSTNLPQSYINQLIWTEMIVIDKEECGNYYGNLLSASNYCARYTPERRLSDSGGPAVYNRELLVGILSYGGTSAEEPNIAILTNISYFNRWIALNTRILLEKHCVPQEISSDSELSSDSDST